MSRHQEPLSGGVVSSRDPSVLNPGELAAARNAHYLPHSPALQRMRGRTSFGAVSATAVDVVGLRDVQFDNGDHLLVAHASASYLTAAVADTGTFGVLSGAVGVGAQLEALQYRNRYFLFNGVSTDASSVGSNRVIYLSATAAGTPATLRQHGMIPVQSTPGYVTAGGGAFSQSVTGYYEYWTTEVAKIRQDSTDLVLESTFTGDPVTIFISATSVFPTISMPLVRNTAITTHWRVYRSPKKDSTAASDRKFPVGFMIAENATAQASAADTAVTASAGPIFPGNMNGVGDGATFFANFTNAARLSADDGSYASAAVPAFPAVIQQQGTYGYNFGGFTGTIRGIGVEFQAYIAVGAGPVPIEVTIGRDRQSDGNWYVGNSIQGAIAIQNNTVSHSASITSTNSAAPNTVTVGGPADTWFPPDHLYPFNSSDFGTAFQVILKVSKAGVSIGFDYVRVTVYYASTFDSTVQFPTVVYTFGDITSQVGKNGKPPDASTGDFYDESLVLNDVSNPSLVRYSFPADVESFPSTYYVDFETVENDQVRCIKVANDRCLVWLDSSVWRLDYLPNERDAQFDRGKARRAISRQHGCVNPMCVAIYSPQGTEERAAFVADQGIFDTNGYDLNELTDSQNWRGTIADLTGTYTPIALLNDRERRQLLFYFQNTNDYGNETYLCLPLCYSPEHLVNGKPKAGGLLHMRNFAAAGGTRADLKSAWAVARSNGDTQVYLGYGGTATAAGAGAVYRENGTSVPAEDSTMRFVTRRMYLADYSNEWELADLYGHATYTGTPSVTYFFSSSKTNDAGPTQLGSKNVTLGGQRLHLVSPRVGTEGLQVTGHVTASSYASEFLVLDGNWAGGQDSGR